jgi:hypothetical protein
MQKKPEVDMNDILLMHPNALILLAAFKKFCITYGLRCVITSLVNDYKGPRVSRSHTEGRAFDASVRDWEPVFIEKLLFKFNRDFKDIAAISYSDKKPRAVIFHDGTAPHLHFQVRR